MFSVVHSLRTFRVLVVPHCDAVILQHTDTRHRNTTRFFTSAARQPPSLSRDHVAVQPSDMTSDVITGSMKLVLVCLDVIILLYRVTHVCCVVSRVRDCECMYCGDEYESDVVRRDTVLDEHDPVLYETSPRSVCGLVTSSYIAKLVMFVALVASSHVTLQLIDTCQLPVHVNLTSLGMSRAALSDLDSDVNAIYRRHSDAAATSFNDFVVNSLSHLSIIIQLANNGLCHIHKSL